MRAFGNMEIVRSVHLATTVFKETLPMSTYLFAFGVGEFNVAEARTKSNKLVRSIASANVSAPQEVWAEFGARALDVMEKLTNFSWPAEKLDHFDMYELGSAEGMENMGLIIYKQILNNLPAFVTTESLIQEIQIVIMHETSHQWFGDLVTNDKWGEEALHESFANFFQNRGIVELADEGDKKILEQYRVDSRDNGLVAMEYTPHPVLGDAISTRLLQKVAVDTNGDLHNDTLDALLYAKAKWQPATVREKVFAQQTLWAAVRNDKTRQAEGLELFNQFVHDCQSLEHLETCNKLPADLRGAVYCAGLRGGDEEAKKFYAQYTERVQNLRETFRYFKAEAESINAAHYCG
ncbi:Peptidase family M1 [Aphelenchoides fujianensis]|nr:Peptidase family M1 [Aphelenchoides fujianensis]